MRICLLVCMVMAFSIAVAGCTDNDPPKTKEAAKPDLGQPGSPTDMHDESKGKSTISTPPEAPDTGDTQKAPSTDSPQPNAAPKEGAAARENGDGKTSAVDDRIDDRDEEEQK